MCFLVQGRDDLTSILPVRYQQRSWNDALLIENMATITIAAITYDGLSMSFIERLYTTLQCYGEELKESLFGLIDFKIMSTRTIRPNACVNISSLFRCVWYICSKERTAYWLSLLCNRSNCIPENLEAVLWHPRTIVGRCCIVTIKLPNYCHWERKKKKKWHALD